MTGHLPRSELPGSGKNQRLLSDVGTWEEIYLAAESVYKRCVVGANRPGWISTGKTSFLHLLGLVSLRESPTDSRS